MARPLTVNATPRVFTWPIAWLPALNTSARGTVHALMRRMIVSVGLVATGTAAAQVEDTLGRAAISDGVAKVKALVPGRASRRGCGWRTCSFRNLDSHAYALEQSFTPKPLPPRRSSSVPFGPA